MPVGIRLDQAGIDGKSFAADKTFGDAAGYDLLEQAPEDVALGKPTVAVLRESRVVGHLTFEAEATEPAIGQIEMHLLTETALGADRVAVSDQQHPDHQLRIDRRAASRAVEAG